MNKQDEQATEWKLTSCMQLHHNAQREVDIIE